MALVVEYGLNLSLPATLECLAAVALREDRPEDAARFLDAAVQARAAHGPAPWPVQQAELATLAASVGTPVDPAPLDDIVTRAMRGRGARVLAATGWSSLTRTELEVVRAGAAGLSNPQICTRLHMSRGTVKTHLAHAFAKLEVRNRTELARIVPREDSIPG